MTSIAQMFKAYISLTKPGIVFGNAVTAAGGFFLASKHTFRLPLFLWALLGLSLIVASGCVLNNYLDRFSDQKMKRTQSRPLAKKSISEKKAFVFGVALFVLGFFLLALFTNPYATSIATLGFVIYVGFYTLWKYKTVYGTEIGSIAGAVPPVVGYCAASGRIDLAALLLFALVALWQMPHFFAIAIYRMREYASASIPVLPIQRGVYVTKIRMLLYMIAFIASGLALVYFQYTGIWFLSALLLLGSGWLWRCVQGFRAQNDGIWARKVFFYSLIVILGLCTALMFEAFLEAP